MAPFCLVTPHPHVTGFPRNSVSSANSAMLHRPRSYSKTNLARSSTTLLSFQGMHWFYMPFGFYVVSGISPVCSVSHVSGLYPSPLKPKPGLSGPPVHTLRDLLGGGTGTPRDNRVEVFIRSK